MVRKKRVTSQDVARRAGVSRTTVSFVLNDVEANISTETKERVRLAAEELGYVPNAAALALARQRTHTVALVLIREEAQIASDAFLTCVMQGLVEVIRPAGFRLLLETVADTDDPDIYLKLVSARQIDGFVLSGPRSDDERLTALVENEFPVVLLGQLDGWKGCQVDVDNRRAARQAVEHLIERGHRRIGCITNAPLVYTSSSDRLAGYRDALEEHGLTFDPSLVRYGDFNPESGQKAARSLLNGGVKRPTALFVASDVVAVGAINLVHELGLAIPEDLAIVGFDDVPSARYLIPPLTTVRLPAIELGRQAGETLIHCIHGQSGPPRTVLLDTELIVRESSRNPRTGGGLSINHE